MKPSPVPAKKGVKNMEERVERRSSLQPFIIGLAAGAVVGGLVALLFAPASGKDTRRKIGDVAYRARERVAGHPAEVHSGPFTDN